MSTHLYSKPFWTNLVEHGHVALYSSILDPVFDFGRQQFDDPLKDKKNDFL